MTNAALAMVPRQEAAADPTILSLMARSQEELFSLMLERKHENLRWLFSQLCSEQLAMRRSIEDAASHFRKMCDFDPLPLLAEVEANEALFAFSNRSNLKAQENTEAIYLRKPDYADTPLKTGYNVQDDIPTRYHDCFPLINHAVQAFARQHGQGVPSRVMIVRLKPGMEVLPHRDRGLYYLVRDRYHFVLKSCDGSEMKAREQTSVWRAGEAWWFNNKILHSARNPSSEWRIHVIFDVLPDRNIDMSRHMKAWADRHRVE